MKIICLFAEALKDPSPAGMEKVGINVKQIVAMGINVGLVIDIGAAVLNPLNLVKMGIDPMSTMIVSTVNPFLAFHLKHFVPQNR